MAAAVKCSLIAAEMVGLSAPCKAAVAQMSCTKWTCKASLFLHALVHDHAGYDMQAAAGGNSHWMIDAFPLCQKLKDLETFHLHALSQQQQLVDLGPESG